MTIFDAVKQLELGVFCDVMYAVVKDVKTQDGLKKKCRQKYQRKRCNRLIKRRYGKGIGPCPFQVDKREEMGREGCQLDPSEVIQKFLDSIRQWQGEYNLAHENVGREDKRLQDLLHGLEFSSDNTEFQAASEKLRESRRVRRINKNTVQLLEHIVQFFGEEQNRKMLNQLTQLLGRQRKQEAFLRSERTYKPRMEDLPDTMAEALKKAQE